MRMISCLHFKIKTQPVVSDTSDNNINSNYCYCVYLKSNNPDKIQEKYKLRRFSRYSLKLTSFPTTTYSVSLQTLRFLPGIPPCKVPAEMERTLCPISVNAQQLEWTLPEDGWATLPGKASGLPWCLRGLYVLQAFLSPKRHRQGGGP